MSEAELPVITRPSGDDAAVQSKRKSYVLKYCFFNHKLGMTFKIVNGRIVLDGVDKQLAERSGPSRRVSSRKSGRLSIVSVVDTKGDDEREEGDGKDAEAGESALHEGNDDAADNDSESPSTPIISMKKMSSKEESPTKQRPSTPSTSDTSAPLAMSSSSQVNGNGTSSAAGFAPVVSTLEYSGIAYGSNDYSVASAAPTSSSHKILVESEFLFGHNVKKMVKISGASINVERIISSVLESCQLTQSPDQLLFTFHDPEVDEFVVLDEFSLADFLQLPKKIVHLQSVAPLIPGASPEKKESKTPSRLASKSDEQEAASASTAQIVSTTPINKADKPLVARAHIVQLITFLGVHINLSYRETRDMLLSAGTYGFVNFLVRLSLSQSRARDTASDSTSCNVATSRWKITADFPPLGSRVLSLNGVFINDLERSQQITLLKQRRRPFVIEFEVFDPPITDSHRPNPPTIKFSLFYSKYTSSYASKLRKQIDKILEDYETCDWADAKRQGTGSPQATIISLYKYIEQELQRLDLFNPKRSRGEGFPLDMKDTHWHAVRTHIESMIFKRIVTPTKELFTLYQEPMDAIDPTDEEYQGNLFLINKRLEPPPSGHEPVLPRALPRVPHSTHMVPTDPLTAAAAAAAAGAASFSASSPQDGSTVPIDAHMHLELSAEHGLNMKLAYLRFVTLEILGIHPAGSEHHDQPSSLERQSSGDDSGGGGGSGLHEKIAKLASIYPPDMASIDRILSERNQIVFQEEWYQAIRGLHQLSMLETPGEMTQRLKLVVDLITRALEKYINRPPSLVLDPQSTMAHAQQAREQDLLTCSVCKQVHLANNDNETIAIPEPLSASTVRQWNDTYGHVNAAVWCPGGSDEAAANDTSAPKHITGDDLLPGLVFALIQANPPNIECLLWLCAEFRHPSLHVGEEAYCLATVSSALEFVRRARYQSVDVIPHILYDHFMLRYTYTLKLMLACKDGDLLQVQRLVEGGADVNGLSPDQVDSPLTACVRYNQPRILYYLLFEQHTTVVHVDAVVHLYRGPHERSTALHIATKQGEVEMVLMLLAAGANRYIADEEGRTPLSIAMEAEQEHLQELVSSESPPSIQYLAMYSSPYALLHTILLADCPRIDVVDMILRKDPVAERLLAGLIVQGVDVHHVHSPRRCHDLCDPPLQQLHAYVTPLMAAVLVEDFQLVKMLLSIPFTSKVEAEHTAPAKDSSATLTMASSIAMTRSASAGDGDGDGDGASYFGQYHNPVDEVNVVGETALLVCVEKCLIAPSEALIAITAILLRAGANRQCCDSFGRSPVSVLAAVALEPSSLSTVEDHRNPFGQEEGDGGDHVVSGVPPPSLASSSSATASHLFPSGALAFYVEQYPEICCPSPTSPAHLSVAPEVAASSADNNAASSASAALLPPLPMKISYAFSGSGYAAAGDEDSFSITTHLFGGVATSAAALDTSTDVGSHAIEALLREVIMPRESLGLVLQSLLLQDPAAGSTAPIYQCTRHHDYASVRALLLQATDVNVVCPTKGYSPLIAAVYNRDVKMIQLLLHSAALARATSPLSATWAPVFFALSKAMAIDASSTSTATAPTATASSATTTTSSDAHRLLPASPTALFPVSFTLANVLQVDQAGRGGMTALHYAAQLGLTTVVGLLLARGAQRGIANLQQHTAVDVAVANGHMDTANVLRFDPHKISLCLAAKHGDWLVMKALLLQGISINVVKEHIHPHKGRHYELDTPLIAAVSHGQYELVKKLLTELPTYAGHGEDAVDTDMVIFPQVLDVNQVNTIGQSALMYAAARGEENIVLLLLKHGADRYAKDLAGHDAVHWAMAQNHTHLATILRHDPDLIYVHDLIRKNDFDAVVAMFKQGVDVNLRRERLLVNLSHPTVVAAREEAAQSTPPVLLPASANSAAGTGTTIGTAAAAAVSSSLSLSSTASSIASTATSSLFMYHHGRRLSAPTVARLEALQEFARMFIPGETPLIVAARYARMDVLQLLFKAPTVDIDAIDDTNGWSALFHAAEQGHEEIVKFLLAKKANRKIEDCLGRCARDIALLHHHEVIAAMIDADPYHVHIHDTCQHGLLMLTIGLLKQGCPPTFRDERPGMHRQTPLMAAASGGQVDIMRMLLRYPAVYDGKDDRDALGRTALMRAAAVGALDATAVLLNAGCDRSLQDQQGLTARDHAARHSFSVMFQFMSQSMVR